MRSAYPTGFSPYWRGLPLARMRRLLAGTFFFFAALAGFIVDLLEIQAPRLAGGLYFPLLFGTLATAMFVARIKKARLVPILAVVLGLATWFGHRVSAAEPSTPIPEALYRRILIDCMGLWVGAGVGYRLLLSFMTVEGLGNVRMQTELSLAHGIQETLVPDLAIANARFEIYGRSVPSTEMGGDLIDVIESEGNTLVYVADISGHGLPAGQLMGMLKTAMRVAVEFHRQPASLLESADRVLPAVKAPDMYATLALLYFEGSNEVEYSLAGHPPILHYRARARDTARLTMEQFPLGLIPGGRYASARVRYAPGDLFLLLTDGIPDVVNQSDADFGMESVERLMTAHAAEPLAGIWTAIMEACGRHGAADDDQTLLLVRAR